MENVVKRFGMVKQLDAADHTFEFVGNTGGLDRSGETIAVDGWQLENWLKNPVILWSHKDWELPVAKGLDARKDAELGLVIKGQWASEHYDFAGVVEAMYGDSFLNGFSVCFQPKAWEDFADGTDDRKAGHYRHYSEQELLEVSVLNIPCDADALALRKGLHSVDVMRGDRELRRMVKMATDLTPAQAPVTNEATKAALEALGLGTTDELVAILEPYLKHGTELGLGADELLAAVKEKLAIASAADPDADAARFLQEVLVGAADALHRVFVG